MRGWVYVITNQAIPGKVKVGYTQRHPHHRAAELDGTGLPLPYSVEFAALVEDPQDAEAEAHDWLFEFRAGREWFDCSVREASEAIRGCSEGQLIFHCRSDGFDAAPKGYRRTEYSSSRVLPEELYLPSPALAIVVGKRPLTRTDATRLVWGYIKAKGLQDPSVRWRINCDVILSAVCGADQASMFELTKSVSRNLARLCQDSALFRPLLPATPCLHWVSSPR